MNLPELSGNSAAVLRRARLRVRSPARRSPPRCASAPATFTSFGYSRSKEFRDSEYVASSSSENEGWLRRGRSQTRFRSSQRRRAWTVERRRRSRQRSRREREEKEFYQRKGTLKRPSVPPPDPPVRSSTTATVFRTTAPARRVGGSAAFFKGDTKSLLIFALLMQSFVRRCWKAGGDVAAFQCDLSSRRGAPYSRAGITWRGEQCSRLFGERRGGEARLL